MDDMNKEINSNIPEQDINPQDIPVQENREQNPPVQNSPEENAPVQDKSEKNVPAPDEPEQNVPVQDIPTEIVQPVITPAPVLPVRDDSAPEISAEPVINDVPGSVRSEKSEPFAQTQDNSLSDSTEKEKADFGKTHYSGYESRVNVTENSGAAPTGQDGNIDRGSNNQGNTAGYGRPNNYGRSNYSQENNRPYGHYGQNANYGQSADYGQRINHSQNVNYDPNAVNGRSGNFNRGMNGLRNGDYSQNPEHASNRSYSRNTGNSMNGSYGRDSAYGQNNNRQTPDYGNRNYGPGNDAVRGNQYGLPAGNPGQGFEQRNTGADVRPENKERFTNDGFGKGRTGYSSSYDSYRFETPVDPAPINPSETRYDKKKKTSVKKDSGNKMTAKRIGAFAGIAALFGLVAALVFLGVTSIAGKKVTEAPSEKGDGIIAAPTPTIILEEPKADSSSVSTGTADTTAETVELTVPQVVEQCMPSMVAITNTTIEEYRDFFGGTSQQESVSAGSGIIVGETETELLIATNNHVIQNSTDITVTFIDEAAITGSIKGMDADNDLAIVAVKLDDIKQETKDAIRIISIGNSDNVVVGESVVAIGNALGYGQSVSAGIISALGREVTIDGQAHSLIQTDASINPGNSGGALINMRGELIGINEVKYVDETVEGVGYAIPMATAEPILSSLGSKAARQKVDDSQASYIGIKCIEVPSYYVQAGYPAGVYVSEVTKGGPAEAAGLKEGDIITAIDGISVSSTSQLINYLQYYAAGEVIDFSVSRLNEDNTAFDSSKIPITLGNKNDAETDEKNSDDSETAEDAEEGQEEDTSGSEGDGAGQSEEDVDGPSDEGADNGGFPFLPDVGNR